MDDLKNYFTFISIAKLVIKYRVKYAFSKNKSAFYDKFHSKKGFNNTGHSKFNFGEYQYLQSLLPPRKQWIKPDAKGRTLYLSALRRNEIALLAKVKRIEEKYSSNDLPESEVPNWFINLKEFTDRIIQRSFEAEDVKIKAPKLIALKKSPPYKDQESELQRRPLSLFDIEDKIILSLTNKYLSKVFDPIFLECSYAFRPRSAETKKVPNHHDSIIKLKEFRIENLQNDLYVTECDIKKFFDCVDHNILVKEYYSLKKELETQYKTFIDDRAEKILFSYLESYSFNMNVFPENFTNYSEKNNDLGARFPWVKELEDRYHEGKLNNQIGIPQGGALSGLIVNMLLHRVDKAMYDSALWSKDYLYLRYCDDMIIIHKDKDLCNKLFSKYTKGLEEMNLFYHKPDLTVKDYGKDFWECKTKCTYLWSNKPVSGILNSFWIGFVGYQINAKGNIRIRKNSVQKECLKHQKEVEKFVFNFKIKKRENLIKNYDEIIRSIDSRLCSMGLGKVDLKDYTCQNFEMCWAKGFMLIEDNKYIRYQLKILDKSRKKAILEVKQFLTKHGICPPEERLPNEKKSKSFIVQNFLYPYTYSSILKRDK